MQVLHADPLDQSRVIELDFLRARVKELEAKLEGQEILNSSLLSLIDKIKAIYEVKERDTR